MTSKKTKRASQSQTNYDLFDYRKTFDNRNSEPQELGLPTLDELYARFRHYNIKYFAGKLETAKIRYSNRLLAAGLFIKDRTEIVISRKYHTLFPEEINDTLKHEMIHLIHFNHDKNFRAEAKRIGAAYKAKSHPDLRLPPRFIYECPVCKIEYPRRKRMRMASCGKCSPSRFNKRYKLLLKESLKSKRS